MLANKPPQSVQPICSVPRQQLLSGMKKEIEDKTQERVEQKKAAVIPIPVATNVAQNVVHNLSNLKLSKMNPVAIRFTAQAISRKVNKTKTYGFYSNRPSQFRKGKQKGRDIVQSANIPSSWRRAEGNSLWGRKLKGYGELDAIAFKTNHPDVKLSRSKTPDALSGDALLAEAKKRGLL